MERGNSFSLRLQQRIDSLLEGQLKAQPRELWIPGLDDMNKDGGGNIFDVDNFDPTDQVLSPTKVKKFKAPHE